MYKNFKIAVVVPAFNEEVLIAKVLTSMPEYVDKVIVVDDCSRDNTAEEVKRLQGSSARPRVGAGRGLCQTGFVQPWVVEGYAALYCVWGQRTHHSGLFGIRQCGCRYYIRY